MAEQREGRPAGNGPTEISPTSENKSSVRPAADKPSRPRRPPNPLVTRDQHRGEMAGCTDCDARWRGPRTRKRAADHAARRGHRVSFVRLDAYELRPKRWPAR